LSNILVVDDDPSVLASIRELLQEQGYGVEGADGVATAWERLHACAIDLMICDVQLSDGDGLSLIRKLKKDSPNLPVVVMTAHGTMTTAIEATKLGALDYLLKPFDPEQLLELIELGLDDARLLSRRVQLNADSDPPPGEDAIVGQSAKMQEVFKAIGRVAATDASVLIRGETGTGKELVARAIYQHSRRANSPFLMVSCVAIPETLLEAELFGYEKGAFTGAVARRIGKFEQAHQGTIFLDEIGDVPASIQAKLLRVLQEKRFERLGGNETVHTDVRVLAATNRDLESAMAAGSFREDLFHRLNVVTIRLPPLRDRPEDVRPLARYFLARYSRELGFDAPPTSPEAFELLERHSWSGNVRELEHCIHRALIFSQGRPIQAQDLQAVLAPTGETTAARSSVSASLHPGMTLRAAERSLIEMTLRSVGGNKKEAARLLGVSRRALYDKLKRYGLE
jgi:DNA-binding NtrC family response regulator